MKPTDHDILVRLETAMLGVKDTDEKGIAGDVKEIKTHLQILNGQVGRNTIFRKTTISIVGSLVVIVPIALKLIGIY